VCIDIAIVSLKADTAENLVPMKMPLAAAAAAAAALLRNGAGHLSSW
jgi:hypothetical protein